MASPTIVHSNINALLQSKSFDPRKDANVKALDDEQRYQLMEHLDCAHPTPFQSLVKAVASYFTGKKDLDTYLERHKTLKGMDKFEVDIVTCLISDPKKVSAGNDSSFLRRVGEFFGHYISNDALIERLVKSKEMLTSTTSVQERNALSPTQTAYKQSEARSKDYRKIVDELDEEKHSSSANKSLHNIIYNMSFTLDKNADLHQFLATEEHLKKMEDGLGVLEKKTKDLKHIDSGFKKEFSTFISEFRGALKSIDLNKIAHNYPYNLEKADQMKEFCKKHKEFDEKIVKHLNAAPSSKQGKATIAEQNKSYEDTKAQIEQFSTEKAKREITNLENEIEANKTLLQNIEAFGKGMDSISYDAEPKTIKKASKQLLAGFRKTITAVPSKKTDALEALTHKIDVKNAEVMTTCVKLLQYLATDHSVFDKNKALKIIAQLDPVSDIDQLVIGPVLDLQNALTAAVNSINGGTLSRREDAINAAKKAMTTWSTGYKNILNGTIDKKNAKITKLSNRSSGHGSDISRPVGETWVPLRSLLPSSSSSSASFEDDSVSIPLSNSKGKEKDTKVGKKRPNATTTTTTTRPDASDAATKLAQVLQDGVATPSSVIAVDSPSQLRIALGEQNKVYQYIGPDETGKKCKFAPTDSPEAKEWLTRNSPITYKKQTDTTPAGFYLYHNETKASYQLNYNDATKQFQFDPNNLLPSGYMVDLRPKLGS